MCAISDWWARSTAGFRASICFASSGSGFHLRSVRLLCCHSTAFSALCAWFQAAYRASPGSLAALAAACKSLACLTARWYSSDSVAVIMTPLISSRMSPSTVVTSSGVLHRSMRSRSVSRPSA